MSRARASAWAVGIVFFGAGAIAAAQSPPKAPVLQIEAGVHLQVIEGLALDSSERWLVTGSSDKTARVWDLAKGTLVRTLRPPIGADNEGLLIQAAIAPDGSTIALGGNTGRQWSNGYSVYLFDRATGEMTGRLQGMSAAISAMSWSRDGALLAIGMFSGKGIRVYRTRDWQLVGEDASYGDTCRGVAFSADGKLAASSEDGSVRVYRVSPTTFERVSVAAVATIQKLGKVRFSPDGKRLAVGNRTGSGIAVLSATTLETLFVPKRPTDGSGAAGGGAIPAVEWSQDGEFLWAGGGLWRTIDGRSETVLRRWPNRGEGVPTDHFVATNFVFDIRALKSGNVAFTSAVPTWGVLDPGRAKVVGGAAATSDYREPSGLLLADTGKTAVYAAGKDPAVIVDVATRKIGAALVIPGAAPRISAPGLVVTQWRNGREPKVNNIALALANGEVSRSLAIDPDAEGFVLGTEWNLRRYDREGRSVWHVDAPARINAVNISSDRKFVVAIVHDGTFRWYRYSDGALLLTVFLHADQKRWVAWTRSGYYDASTGGEELIGWTINRSAEQAADFFPVSRFRDRLHRPDVIDRILDTLSEQEALRRANEASGRSNAAVAQMQDALPPVVRLLTPSEGAEISAPTVSIKASFRFASEAPLTAIRARVNGQAVALATPIDNPARIKSGEAVEFGVPIPAQDSEIAVFGESRNGVSAPATVRVTWKGPSTLTEAAKPKLYVLAVGVSVYDNPEYRLEYPAKDAKDFAAAMSAQKGQLYRDVEVKLLTDKAADRDSILDGLDWLQRQVTQRDVGMLFLAGHGINSNDGVYYFAPVNFDLERSRRTGVVFNEIKNTLVGLPGKAIFFIDTCHSGNILGGRRAMPNMASVVNELSSAENGVVVFSSSTGREFSLEAAEWNNGAFTKALVEGIGGKADIGNTGRVTHKMLDIYVSERVKELTKGKQHPVTQAPGGVPDFPLAATAAR